MKKIIITLLALLAAAALAGCGKTEAPPSETTASASQETTAETDTVFPDGHYIGVWFSSDIKEAPPYATTPHITIMRIMPEYIHFKVKISADIPYIGGKAIERDGEIVFGDGITEGMENTEGMRGTLSFVNDGVTVRYDSLGKYGTEGETLTQRFTQKNEPDIMSWPANDLPEAVRSDLQGIIDEITEKGWVDIEVLPHEPNTSLRWNLGYPAVEIPDGATLYCVTGRSPANGGPVYNNIYSVYDGESKLVEPSEVYYISLLTRDLRGIYLDSFMRRRPDDSHILNYDDTELIYYFFPPSMLRGESDESSTANTTEPNDSAELTAKKIKMEEWAAENRTVLKEIPRFEQNGMVIRTAEDALKCAPYETTFLPKYRDIYYWEPSFLYDIVDQDAAAEWYETFVRPDRYNNAEPKEMYTVSFVKYFEISREDFERCCEQKRKRLEYLRDELGHDINIEGAEIPNADIIYTFDNEIINNYYLRDQEGIIYTPADEY